MPGGAAPRSFLLLPRQFPSPGYSPSCRGSGKPVKAVGKFQDGCSRAGFGQLPSDLPRLLGTIEPLRGHIPTRVHHIGPTRLSATLARGADRFNHFDHEAPPQAELDEAALAVHADSQSRYWKAASGIAEMRHIH
jgi:hypothetical protein